MKNRSQIYKQDGRTDGRKYSQIAQVVIHGMENRGREKERERERERERVSNVDTANSRFGKIPQYLISSLLFFPHVLKKKFFFSNVISSSEKSAKDLHLNFFSNSCNSEKRKDAKKTGSLSS